LILYLDTSALVKRYIAENNSALVQDWFNSALLHGTASITFVEMASALAKATRLDFIKPAEAKAVWQVFQEDWDDFVSIQLTQHILAKASELAWKHSLRGYDAVHLASTLTWQEVHPEPVTLITFDRQLWQAGKAEGLAVLPAELV
jgi:predicted nucleic acid-binding protein